MGGHNRKTNKVLLTPKEHYVCHLMLVHMTTSKFKAKLYYGIIRMSKSSKHPNRYNSRLYSFHREKLGCYVSGVNNPNYGNKWSTQKKQELSNYLKSDGRRRGSNNSTFGITRHDLIQRNKQKKIWLTNGLIDKLVIFEEQDQYIKCGFWNGRSNST